MGYDTLESLIDYSRSVDAVKRFCQSLRYPRERYQEVYGVGNGRTQSFLGILLYPSQGQVPYVTNHRRDDGQHP